MAASFSETNIIGNLGRDPEYRVTNDGLEIARFSVAVSYRQKNGVEEVTWYNVATFGKLAGTCNTYLRRGSTVFISGRMKSSKFEGNDGVPRVNWELIANQVVFLDKKGAEPQPGYSTPSPAQPPYQQAPPTPPVGYSPAAPPQGGYNGYQNYSTPRDIDDEIPF